MKAVLVRTQQVLAQTCVLLSSSRPSSRPPAPFLSAGVQQQLQVQLTPPGLLTPEFGPLSGLDACFNKWLAEVYTGGATCSAGP